MLKSSGLCPRLPFLRPRSEKIWRLAKSRANEQPAPWSREPDTLFECPLDTHLMDPPSDINDIESHGVPLAHTSFAFPHVFESSDPAAPLRKAETGRMRSVIGGYRPGQRPPQPRLNETFQVHHKSFQTTTRYAVARLPCNPLEPVLLLSRDLLHPRDADLGRARVRSAPWGAILGRPSRSQAATSTVTSQDQS
jgi:hypothetical protein